MTGQENHSDEQGEKQERDAIVRAAHAYDQLNSRIASLRDDLDEATLKIASRDAEIGQLQIALAAERSRLATFEDMARTAISERAAVVTLFHSLKHQVDHFTINLPPLPVRRVEEQPRDGITGNVGVEGSGDGKLGKTQAQEPGSGQPARQPNPPDDVNGITKQ